MRDNAINTMRIITLILTASLLISGCSWIPFIGDDKEEDVPETEGYSEKDFYDVIQRNLNAHNWETAIKNLQALEAQFPFGNYAEQAQLELIYAYHKSADYEAAIAAADRFIRLHPRHPNVDYAFYLKGLSYFAQSRGFLDNFLPTDKTQRDPGTARSAFGTFAELLSQYPESPYAADTRKRMIHLRNVLARYEIHVANYYFKRGAYVAAANRGRHVVENYQMTPSVPDGLAVMTQAYYLLGLQDLADDSATVLAANYPEHPALDANGNFRYRRDFSGEDKGIIERLTFGLYDVKAPPSYDSRAIYNPLYRDKRVETADREGSWLKWITFGLFD